MKNPRRWRDDVPERKKLERRPASVWWARLLHDLRTAQGLSQREAAQRAGVCQSTWAIWERGEHAPTLPAFEAALGALGHEIEVMAR